MTDRLRDKVIVVVGGTTGLGLSAAQACVKEGAKVVVVGRSEQNAIAATKALGANSCYVAGDATQPPVAEDAVRMAVDRFGRLDGLYHVAGGSGRRWGDGPLDEITDEGWEKTIELNLTSLMNSNRAVVRQLIRQGTGGSIVNMGSVLSDSPSPKHFATHTYAATKAAAVGLTKAAASYYAGKNIRFNIVEPALVETPMSERAVTDSEIVKYVETKQPLDGGRIGRPGDLDGAIIYLLSDESKVVTGQVLKIDGGWSMTEGQHD